MYVEDGEGNFAAFLIADIRGDGVFLEAFKALERAGFDMTVMSSSRCKQQSFICRLYQSKYVSVKKMQAVLRAKPTITPEMVSQLIVARVEITKERGN